MQRLRFKRWRVRVDPAATRKAYGQIDIGSAESCGCRPCRNFVVARQHVFPPAVLDLFRRLGIALNLEAEVYHLGRSAPGVHLYGGWFHFVGRIESGRDAWRQVGSTGFTDDLVDIRDGFSIGFTAHTALVRKPFKGQPLVQVEFRVMIPWILEETEAE